MITRTSDGLLIAPPNGEPVHVVDVAIPTALPAIILTLCHGARAIAQARQEGYAQGHADGLTEGRCQATREYEAAEAKLAAEAGYALLTAPLAA